jgi:hypothetical protein
LNRRRLQSPLKRSGGDDRPLAGSFLRTPPTRAPTRQGGGRHSRRYPILLPVPPHTISPGPTSRFESIRGCPRSTSPQGQKKEKRIRRKLLIFKRKLLSCQDTPGDPLGLSRFEPCITYATVTRSNPGSPQIIFDHGGGKGESTSTAGGYCTGGRRRQQNGGRTGSGLQRPCCRAWNSGGEKTRISLLQPRPSRSLVCLRRPGPCR